MRGVRGVGGSGGEGPRKSPGEGRPPPRLWLILERLLSGLALLVLTPLLLLIGVAVRVESRGPALFRQLRLGRGGRPFRLLKFRTMHMGMEEGIPQVRRRVVESGRDPRITRIGRFLRATSLDELPQLWHVVRGEMALVGPRPVLPEQREAMPRWAEVRFRVAPGLTGLAQVKGRRSLGWLEQLRWDRVFVRRDSIRLRVWIVLRTLVVLVRPEKLYGDAGRNWRAYLPTPPSSHREP